MVEGEAKNMGKGNVCIVCLGCVVQYFGNDATFCSATTNTDRLLSHEM